MCLNSAERLTAEDRGNLLRRATRHRDASVRRLAARLRKAAPLDAHDQQLPGLTSRETEVLRLISEGLDNDNIATTLFIAPSTVKTHVNRIFVKLGTFEPHQCGSRVPCQS